MGERGGMKSERSISFKKSRRGKDSDTMGPIVKRLVPVRGLPDVRGGSSMGISTTCRNFFSSLFISPVRLGRRRGGFCVWCG